jgi:hypothetical protein
MVIVSLHMARRMVGENPNRPHGLDPHQFDHKRGMNAHRCGLRRSTSC